MGLKKNRESREKLLEKVKRIRRKRQAAVLASGDTAFRSGQFHNLTIPKNARQQNTGEYRKSKKANL